MRSKYPDITNGQLFKRFLRAELLARDNNALLGNASLSVDDRIARDELLTLRCLSLEQREVARARAIESAREIENENKRFAAYKAAEAVRKKAAGGNKDAASSESGNKESSSTADTKPALP